MKRYFLAACVALSATACSQDVFDFLGRSWFPENFNKPAMIAQMTRAVVIPGYKAFADEATLLATSLRQLAAEPSPALRDAARTQWQKTAAAWNATENYRYGLAEEQRMAAQIAYWPRRVDAIQAVLKAATPLKPADWGATRKGLPVIEYLLFNAAAPDVTHPDQARTRDYLVLLSADLSTQATTLLNWWQQPERPAAQGADPSALNRQLNQWVMALEDTKNKRLGLALGLDQGGKVDVTQTEAPDSQASLALLEAVFEALVVNYRGGTTTAAPGIDDYLIALGHRRLHTQIETQMTQIRKTLTEIERLEVTLQTNSAQVQALYDQFRELLRYIKVDLANALNETVHFTDNDGD